MTEQPGEINMLLARRLLTVVFKLILSYLNFFFTEKLLRKCCLSGARDNVAASLNSRVMGASHVQALLDTDTLTKLQTISSAQLLFFLLVSHYPSPAARFILSYWPQADFSCVELSGRMKLFMG